MIFLFTAYSNIVFLHTSNKVTMVLQITLLSSIMTVIQYLPTSQWLTTSCISLSSSVPGPDRHLCRHLAKYSHGFITYCTVNKASLSGKLSLVLIYLKKSGRNYKHTCIMMVIVSQSFGKAKFHKNKTFKTYFCHTIIPYYTPGIYAAGYIVFALTFVRSYVRSFVCSFVRYFPSRS